MRLPFPDSRYEVLVAREPVAVMFAFEPALFNLPEYLALQQNSGQLSFYLLRKTTGQAVALFHVHVAEETAVSPFRAPFGSLETQAGLSLALTENLAQTVLNYLAKLGVKELSVKHYPFCYAEAQSALVVNAFLNLGLNVSLSQVNHHVPVTAAPFASLLHSSERRRLQKCQAHGFTFQPENPSVLPEAYAFIKACRQEKNKPLSLSEAALTQLFQQFPDRYLIFSVRNNAEIAALSVAVKVRADVLLSFYPASPYTYNAFSPAVMLNAGLYQYCQDHQMATLDFGISGVKEDPHYSLMQFKEHLGGQPSLKFTFTGNLK